MKPILIVLLMLLAPAPLLAQRNQSQALPDEARREALRQQIERRFEEIAARQLGLNDGQRQALRETLAASTRERRQLAQRGVALRQEAARALQQQSGARDAGAILRDLERLREAELSLWRQEQNRLADILNDRQRLELMALRARFDRRIVELRQGGAANGQGAAPRRLPQRGPRARPGQQH